MRVHGLAGSVRRHPCVVVFALAAGVRLAAMVVFETWEFAAADGHWAAGWETGRIASHLAAGRGYVLEMGAGWIGLAPTAWLAPLYPAWVGVVFRCLGPFDTAAIVTVLLVQLLCSAATAGLLVRIGTSLDTPRVGLVAGLCLAFSPSSVNTSTRIIWCTSLLTLLCTALVLVVLRQRERGGLGRAIGLGVLVGATLLTSPVPAIFVLGAAAWWVRSSGRPAASDLLFATAAAVLVVGPWILRNRGVFGEWFFVKSNFGNELYVGNHAGADGAYRPSVVAARANLDAETLELLAADDELQRARRLGAEARGWIADHPGRFVTLTLSRIHRFWRSPFLTDWERLPLGRFRGPARVGYDVARDVVLVLAGIGILAATRRRGGWWLPVAFLLLFPLSYYATHAGISRYRYPVVPLLLLMASLGAAEVASRWRRRHAPPTTPRAGSG